MIKNNSEQQYLDLCRHILENGVDKSDRTGTGTKSVFGYQMRFNLADGFPLLTTKRIAWHSVMHELLWFLRGDTNVAYLQKNAVTIWNEWAATDGSLGPVYGEQWRSWGVMQEEIDYDSEDNIYSYINHETIDQIAQVIETIRTNPDSRRMLVSAWNVAELDDMALPPCHFAFQFYVANGKLSCQLYQRSGDVFLGIPFNIASYALLTHMIAYICGLEVGEFVHTIGDAHIYSNHIDKVQEQLTREPREMPTLMITADTADIDSITADDIILEGYDPHPKIRGKVAV